ncbi:MAG: hypothetical protein WDZ37_02670 [Solirubrobacterales bacterium]
MSEPRAHGRDEVERELDLADVLSGESGVVEGRRQLLRARSADLLDAVAAWSRLVPPRLARAARTGQSRSVHVAGVYGDASAATMEAAMRELGRGHHDLTFALGATGEAAPDLSTATALTSLDGGKFENLNALLRDRPRQDSDWLLIIDDDVELPHGFLDRFLFLADRFGFQLAQPALTRASHAAWNVMRRERGTVARLTRMVEIGPLTALHRSVVGELLPFPDVKMGWGLDSWWGALALERGWRLGVVDAAAVRHELRATAASYDRREAELEAAALLTSRPHIDRRTALTVAERYRSWE